MLIIDRVFVFAVHAVPVFRQVSANSTARGPAEQFFGTRAVNMAVRRDLVHVPLPMFKAVTFGEVVLLGLHFGEPVGPVLHRPDQRSSASCLLAQSSTDGRRNLSAEERTLAADLVRTALLSFSSRAQGTRDQGHEIFTLDSRTPPAGRLLIPARRDCRFEPYSGRLHRFSTSCRIPKAVSTSRPL